MQSNMSFQTASKSSAIEINKVLKNTYMLLSMTLAFSAVTAGISMSMGLSHMAGLIMTLVAFVLLFVGSSPTTTGGCTYFKCSTTDALDTIRQLLTIKSYNYP